MQGLQIVLRIVHIGAGIVWVGSVVFFFLFLAPSAAAVGGQATALMVHLLKQRRLGVVIAAAATLNVGAGLILYWRASGGLDPDWITTPTGLGFTVGAISALTAFVIGVGVVRISAERVADIGAAVLASGGPPTPEQGAEMATLQGRLRRWGPVLLILLAVAVLAMASARYLG